MAEGGYERLPQWDEDIPDDDKADERDSFIPIDDNADETGAFVPNGASTPAPEFQTEQREKSGLLHELPGL